jgi:hypothetical protein
MKINKSIIKKKKKLENWNEKIKQIQRVIFIFFSSFFQFEFLFLIAYNSNK